MDELKSTKKTPLKIEMQKVLATCNHCKDVIKQAAPRFADTETGTQFHLVCFQHVGRRYA